MAWSTASGADGKSDAMRKTRRVDGLVDLVVGFLVTSRRQAVAPFFVSRCSLYSRDSSDASMDQQVAERGKPVNNASQKRYEMGGSVL